MTIFQSGKRLFTVFGYFFVKNSRFLRKKAQKDGVLEDLDVGEEVPSMTPSGGHVGVWGKTKLSGN